MSQIASTFLAELTSAISSYTQATVCFHYICTVLTSQDVKHEQLARTTTSNLNSIHTRIFLATRGCWICQAENRPGLLCTAARNIHWKCYTFFLLLFFASTEWWIFRFTFTSLFPASATFPPFKRTSCVYFWNISCVWSSELENSILIRNLSIFCGLGEKNKYKCQ